MNPKDFEKRREIQFNALVNGKGRRERWRIIAGRRAGRKLRRELEGTKDGRLY